MPALALTLTSLVAFTAVTGEAAAGPRAAVRAYFEAVLRGDAAAALALVDRPGDADRMAVQASAASEGGLRRLEGVARERFGARGDLGVQARHERLLAAVARAPVQVNGDRAVLRPQGYRAVRLRRREGVWKVESPADRLTGEERKALERALRDTEQATRELGDRIRSGAVKSAQEVRDALRRALGHDEEEGVPL